ncbi:hypothetical protein AMS68_001721 [Peltaster fructicola]|uniref:Uncharacterized protein n=1 Tax=Peltaster fructicola TaxID=286661 RepID=A0A6H0XNB1_9PEZI|nr:hypothetical protein AMS68_001721 [Peltaster fructicola]
MDDIEKISVADRKRFATCYQHSHDKQNVDWASASAAYDPKVKEAWFKTVTSRALKSLEAPTDEAIPEGNLNRLAICYLFSNDKQGVDWPVAAKAYDSKVKSESFRTVVQRALRKHGYAAAAAKKKAAAPRKRKADAGADAGDDIELAAGEGVAAKKTKSTPAKKTTAPRKAKTKAKASIKEESEVEEGDSDAETEKAVKAKKKPRKALKTLQTVEEEKHESDDELAD